MLAYWVIVPRTDVVSKYPKEPSDSSLENNIPVPVFVNKKVLQKGVKKVSTFNTQ